MAYTLKLPRMGNTVESCIIASWAVKVGDTVTEDTTVCDVETDKATFEVPAGHAGTVLKILRPEGDDVPVLDPIAIIGEPGEAAAVPPSEEATAPTPEKPAAVAEAAVPLSVEDSAQPARVAESPEMIPAHNTNAASPRARNLAKSEAVDTATLAGTGPDGRVIERDVRAAVAQRGPLTSAARNAISQSRGDILVAPTPTGIGGRATLADISAATTESTGDNQSGNAAVAPMTDTFADTPIRGIRKVIADRMMASLANAAQFTLNASADATAMQALRAKFKAAPEVFGLGGVTLNDLILFAVSRLLKQYPYMNAHSLGNAVRTFERVHLGVAVDTPKGLMVSVIRNADTLTLTQISAEAKRLSKACREGTAKPEELSGSTFTITNIGMLGVESFTPVLNAPEVGILGVCAITQRPVQVANSAVALVPHIGYSLTIDHRIVDGAPAAQFLKALCDTTKAIDLFLI